MSLQFILLMQPEEAGFFEGLLCDGQTGRAFCAETSDELASLAARMPGARLIAFSTDIIVPAAIIDRLNGDCFNFHSGPPERPGYKPYAFALAEGMTEFGVTFHRMVAEVDAGEIYAVRRFPIDPELSETDVSVIVYQQLLSLAVSVGPYLSLQPFGLPVAGFTWGAVRSTRRQYARLLGDRAVLNKEDTGLSCCRTATRGSI